MPQIGPLEIMLVAVIALIVFGPQRLPEIARSLGKGIAEFRRQASDIKSEFQSSLDSDDDADGESGPEDEQPAPPALPTSPASDQKDLPPASSGS